MPESLICAGCALLCDDVTTDGLRLEPECALGDAWLADRWAPAGDVLDAPDVPDATVAGVPADPATALARAAQLLRDARRPLVHGFANATIEDARAAVTLADRLGAIVATGALAQPWPGAPAFPLRGSSSATLGEIRDRSQLVIVWREDPETTHPRLLQRLGFGAGGSPTRVDGPRTLVVVDDRDTATARRADLVVDWPEDRDVEALAELFERFDDARHATVVYGAALAAGAGRAAPGAGAARARPPAVARAPRGDAVTARHGRGPRRRRRARLADRVCGNRGPRIGPSGAADRDRAADRARADRSGAVRRGRPR